MGNAYCLGKQYIFVFLYYIISRDWKFKFSNKITRIETRFFFYIANLVVKIISMQIHNPGNIFFYFPHPLNADIHLPMQKPPTIAAQTHLISAHHSHLTTANCVLLCSTSREHGSVTQFVQKMTNRFLYIRYIPKIPTKSLEFIEQLAAWICRLFQIKLIHMVNIA